jgi:hypothetical protein
MAADFAVEQQAAPSAPEQHCDLPSFFVEHEPSLPPQQPFWPSLVLQAIPTAEHLQPSFVPPVVAVGSAFASTIFGLFCAVFAGDDVAAGGLAAVFVLVVLVGVSVPPHAANPTTTKDNIAANFNFMIFLKSYLD